MRSLPALWVLLVVGVMLGSLATMAMSEHEEASRLVKFNSDPELRAFLIGHSGRSQVKGPVSSDLAEGSSASDGAPHSSTNVQVVGVDESDRVKTDGEHIYIGDAGAVHVIRAGPPMAKVSEIVISDNGSAQVEGLYLHRGLLTAVCSEYGPAIDALEVPAISPLPYLAVEQTFVRVYDVSDPAAPRLVRTAGMSGYQVTSRMIGPTIYLITEHSIWSSFDNELRLPELTSGGTRETVKATEISYDPAMSEVSSFVNLLAFNTSSGKTGTLTALVGSTSVAYMSPTALYLTMQLWDGATTRASSKLTTSIYRISVEGTEMSLEAQGSVRGRPLNQFALDEKDGRLRIATTAGWWSDASNEVHVLDLKLKEVGAATGIAPGESIYSCRFMGDRLYLVTFLQIDPLFIVDLSSDTPRVLGELKVPGASNYLQMVEGGLMGIGFENGSVKVSLFDVNDPENMRQIDTFVVEGFSYSPAQYDHRAVLYIHDRNMLVIPVTYYSAGYWNDTMGYYLPSSAALVLQLGSDIREVGRIVHENATVDRSLFIGDVLYTISDTTIRASSLAALEDLGSLTYSGGRHDRYGYDAISVVAP